MSEATVIIGRDGPVLTVGINRPRARNAVDAVTAKALYEAFVAFDADEEAAVAVLHGVGDAFCAGADLKEVGAGKRPRLATDTARGPMGPTRLLTAKPVLAAVAGPAVAGGLELALWCDMRIAEESAYFGVYCRRWGVPLVDGGTVRLPRIVGAGHAMDMILTGRRVDAAEALGMGLANRVVPDGTALEAAVALGRELAAFPQICLNADRYTAHRQWSLSLEDALKAEVLRGAGALAAEAVDGAARFAAGAGRHGRFGE